MTAFVGRDLELGKLKELTRLGVASLVVIKGRRRSAKAGWPLNSQPVSRAINPCSSQAWHLTRRLRLRMNGRTAQLSLLFNELFQKKQFHRRLIAVAAEMPVELEDIYRKLNVEKAGYISECIQDLIEAGFLARHYTWNVKTGGPSKRSLIRVIDNYTRFYFRCIKPNKAAVERAPRACLPAAMDSWACSSKT